MTSRIVFWPADACTHVCSCTYMKIKCKRIPLKLIKILFKKLEPVCAKQASDVGIMFFPLPRDTGQDGEWWPRKESHSLKVLFRQLFWEEEYDNTVTVKKGHKDEETEDLWGVLV